MIEPTKCLDHLETDEGDFFCHLHRGHGGVHSFAGESSASVGPVLRYRLEWYAETVLTPITEKEG